MAILVPSAVLMLYLIWAAGHDISRANSTDCTLEYSVLLLSVTALAVIWRKALQILGRRGRIAWLGATAAILVLYSLSALSASLNPKFGNDFIVGLVGLFVLFPLLGYVSHRFAITLRNN